jgi:hypothetical protein
MLLMIVLGLAASQQATDQVAAMREGKLQCVHPNPLTKTCMALSRYELVDGGDLRVHANMLIDPIKSITLEMTSPATFEDGAVCGVYDEALVRASTVRVKDEAASADLTKALLDSMAEASRPHFGHKICTRIVRRHGALVSVGTVNGVPDPALDLPMRWVAPSEGYTLGL